MSRKVNKKQRRKANNPQVRYARAAEHTLRNIVVSFITGDDYCNLIDYKRKKLATVTQAIADMVDNVPYKWSIMMAVFGTGADGRPYMKSELVQTQTRYYQRDLVDLLNERHTALIKTMNPNQMIGAGWMSSPRGIDWDEKEAFDLFEQFGAFDRERQEDGSIRVIIKEQKAA